MCVGAFRVGQPRVSAGDSCPELGAEGSLHRPEPGRETRTGGDEKVGHGPSVGSAEVTSLGSVVLGRIPGAIGVCVASGGGRSRERQGRGPDRVSTVARCKSPGPLFVSCDFGEIEPAPRVPGSGLVGGLGLRPCQECSGGRVVGRPAAASRIHWGTSRPLRSRSAIEARAAAAATLRRSLGVQEFRACAVFTVGPPRSACQCPRFRRV